MYFSGHILAIFCAALLPLVLPPPKQEKNDEKSTSDEKIE